MINKFPFSIFYWQGFLVHVADQQVSLDKFQLLKIVSNILATFSLLSVLSVSNSEVKRYFPPHEIRFKFFLQLRRWFYPFHVENNSKYSSWTLYQRNIDVYIKQMKWAVNTCKSSRSQSRVNDASLILLPNMAKVILTWWCSLWAFEFTRW